MNKPKFLIVYATREGQTETVANKIAATFQELGGDVDVLTPKTAPEDWEEYAGVVLGASIHMGQFEPEMVQLAKVRANELAGKKACFFAVCLAALREDSAGDQEVQSYLERFRDDTNWHPTMMTAFAGALRYSRLGFVKRWVMKQIAKSSDLGTDTSQDYEYTNWKSVEAFAEDAFGHVVGEELLSFHKAVA